MSGMFEPKDGDFASYIKNFNAKTIEPTVISKNFDFYSPSFVL